MVGRKEAMPRTLPMPIFIPTPLKTEIIVPFGFLNVPLLKSPILGGNFGFFGPLFQRARLIWALEYQFEERWEWEMFFAFGQEDFQKSVVLFASKEEWVWRRW